MTVTAQTLQQATLPWRPVQFLGTKLRSLDLVASQIADLADSHGRIWEPFVGSSVVSQRLASEGHQLWATDALECSVVFAATMLSVGRAQARGLSLNEAVNMVRQPTAIPSQWAPWVERERKALAAADGPGLLACGRSIPQRWRPSAANPQLRTHFSEVEVAAAASGVRHEGLISTTYAGQRFATG